MGPLSDARLRTANREPNLSASTPRTADGKPDLNGLWDMFGNTEVGSVRSARPETSSPVTCSLGRKP
jgi:hypothetical protein